MPIKNLHPDEFRIPNNIPHSLIQFQFPQYANLTISPLPTQGTDNALFSLGPDKLIRLPRTPSATVSLKNETQILQLLAHHPLPIPIPQIPHTGSPSETFPHPWLITDLLPGNTPSTTNPINETLTAKSLANFILALQKIPTTNLPQSPRGLPLHSREPQTSQTIPQLPTNLNPTKLLKFWNHALTLPIDKNPPTLLHGDLHPANLLAQNNHLTAIIDFGSAGTGSPTADLLPAYTLFQNKEARQIFKQTLNPTENTWQQAQAWALSFAAQAYPYYKNTNPQLANIALNTLHNLTQDL